MEQVWIGDKENGQAIKCPVWNPFFSLVDSIEVCADKINQPHEDYPIRVPITQALIRLAITSDWTELDEATILYLHRELFLFNPNDIKAGAYRDCMVQVGPHLPPPPILLQELMDLLLPVKKGIDPTVWYKQFETVHPFQDGNGRIGGIVLAWLSYEPETKLMMAPGQ